MKAQVGVDAKSDITVAFGAGPERDKVADDAFVRDVAAAANAETRNSARKEVAC